MHGVILAGFYDLSGSVFHNRSPGAYKIADHCRKLGWSIEVIDHVSHWEYSVLFDYISKIVEKNNSKWLGISYTWLWKWPNLKKLLNEIKIKYPELLLIAGGQAVYNEDLGCHWYVYGYAEDALIKVLDYEFNNSVPLIYSKLFSGKYVNAVHNYPSFNNKNYSVEYVDNDFLTSQDVLSLELSRGCKFKCNYCSYPFIGISEDTSTSEEFLYRELNENYEKYKIKNYILAEDTANDRIEKLIKLSNVVKRLDFEPNFAGFLRADLIAAHPEQIELLAESRLWAQYYGVETFNHRSGKSIGKGQDPDKTKNSLLKIKEYFLKNVGCYRGTIGLIAGLPYEDMNSLLATQAWCEENWSDQHWLWWPLQIELDQDSLSAFGKDFKKFGYRPLSVENYKADFVVKNTKNNFLWEHDYLSVIEAERFCSEIAEKFVSKLDNFSIISYVPFFGEKKSQEIKATLLERYKTPDYVELSTKKIHEYIKKKCILTT